MNVPEHLSPSKPIKLKECLAYAAGDTASNLYFKTFSTFLMFFYTDVFGLSIAAVAAMLFVIRTWDWINDPVMGIVADRTSTSHGKFRPWLRWMIVPLALAGISVFTAPDLSDNGKLVYAYVTYGLWGMAYTAINIPYGALMGVMTPNREERTRLSSFRFYGAHFGSLMVAASLLPLVAALGRGDDATGYQRTVLLYSILASALFLFTFSGTQERLQPPRNQKNSTRADLGLLMKNRPWLAMIVIGVSTIMWIAVRDSVVLYYFKYFVGDSLELTTWFYVIGIASTLGGIGCTSWFTRLFGGKRPCFISLTLGVAICSVAFYFARPQDMALILGTQVAVSFLAGPLMPLFWSMIADTADYAEWKHGRRFTGLIFSAGNLSQKIGWAVGPILAGSLMSYYGYEANVEQTPEMLQALKLMISLIPSGMGVLTAAIVLAYRISPEMEKQIELELAQRRERDA